jgi:hypothetical protein
MATELETTFIYIDTCVFEHRQFDLQSTAFKTLLTLANDGHADLLTSAITVGECHKHIRTYVGQASNVRNKLSAEARILKRFEEYASLFEKPDKDSLSSRLINEFNEYLVKAKAKHINLNAATVTDIVQQYLDERPPFGSEKDKKAEFPDAIVLSALSAWCEENGESAYVITRDKNMRDACATHPKLHPLTDLNDFLDLVSSEEAVAAARIKSIFRNRSNSLVKEIGNKFRNVSFSVRHLDAEVEINSIEKINFDDPEIISIEEESATVEVECEVTFTAEVTYEDPDSGVWDSEDRRMLFVETVHRSVEDSAYVLVEVLFEYKSLAALADSDRTTLSVSSIVQYSIEIDIDKLYY